VAESSEDKKVVHTDGESYNLRGCTLVYSEPEYWNYYRGSSASFDSTKSDNFLKTDYEKNKSKYHISGDYLRRDVYIRYPFKDGEVAVIDNYGTLSGAKELKASTSVRTQWVMFNNNADEITDKMHSTAWTLPSLKTVDMPNAKIVNASMVASGNVRASTMTAPQFNGVDWLIFSNDGGWNSDAANRLYNTAWKINKVTEITAPKATLTVDKINVGGYQINGETLNSLSKLISGLTDAQISALNNFAKSLTVEE
jgi:hypothetical protein